MIRQCRAMTNSYTPAAKKLQLIYSILTVLSIPFSFGMFIYCPANTYAGVDVAYLSNTNSTQLRYFQSRSGYCLNDMFSFGLL